MASRKTKFTVGLFVTGGVAFALVAVIWLGMSRFFAKGRYYVTYFNESVQGLDIESPVKYRGVPIGRVKRIGVAPDSKLIEVVLRIESGQSLDSSIVAQLKSVGITGSMFVELDRKRKGEPDLSPQVTFPSEYPIVASKPSEISELVRGIDDVLDQFRSVDLKGISKKIKVNLDDINQIIHDADVKGVSEDVRTAIAGISRIFNDQRWDTIMGEVEQAGRAANAILKRADSGLSHVQDIVRQNEQAIGAAIENFEQAMQSANAFLQQGASLVNGTNEAQARLRRHLLVIVQHLERASENLQRLMDLVADHPSQLVFGQPPAARHIEPEINDN
ncbi:MAG: MCE family protein [Deltaproteobacteria bacterium]|nr:MCE family protein [Deltaproteobacteria bacterium]